MELPVQTDGFLSRFDRLYIRFRQTVALLGMPFEAAYDMVLFVSRCRLSPFVPRHKRDTYDLIFFSHTIEKGLSLPEPRPLFGRNNICRVLYLLRHCDPDKTGPAALGMGVGCLHAYLEHHARHNVEAPFLTGLKHELDSLAGRFATAGEGGTKDVAGIFRKIEARQLSYEEFLRTRFSCRNFRKEPVPLELIREVTGTAQQAPSQCNRQSTRVHLYQDKDDIARLLAHQGGARGFAAHVPTILVITNEMSAWVSKVERNQCYVDAGLFAMALLYACHARGLGVCALNFAKSNLEERRFKKVARIPAGERVAMLIAVGFQDESCAVAARSVRCPTGEVLHTH